MIAGFAGSHGWTQFVWSHFGFIFDLCVTAVTPRLRESRLLADRVTFKMDANCSNDPYSAQDFEEVLGRANPNQTASLAGITDIDDLLLRIPYDRFWNKSFNDVEQRFPDVIGQVRMQLFMKVYLDSSDHILELFDGEGFRLFLHKLSGLSVVNGLIVFSSLSSCQLAGQDWPAAIWFGQERQLASLARASWQDQKRPAVGWRIALNLQCPMLSFGEEAAS